MVNDKMVNVIIFAGMQQAFDYIRTELNAIYPEPELGSIAYLLISEITGLSRTQILINKNTKISDIQRTLLISFVEELKNHKPVQYLFGHTEFYGLRFHVGQGVLIPRPETEELVEWIFQTHKNKRQLRMLDIGTGSGCIAVTLKSLLGDAFVTAYDVSEAALEIAASNAKLNNCEVEFIRQDILRPDATDCQWDVIVSNPPYIPEAEKPEILPNVLDYEPHIALFVPDSDPLLFYTAIANYAIVHLKTGGELYFEIHRDFGKQIVQMLEQKGFSDIVLRKDMSGNDRMIRATFTKKDLN